MAVRAGLLAPCFCGGSPFCALGSSPLYALGYSPFVALGSSPFFHGSGEFCMAGRQLKLREESDRR
jgi:hypothetical protein